MQAGDGHQEMVTGLMTVRGHEEDDDVDDDDDAGFNREETKAAAILLSLPMAGEALACCRLALSPVWGRPRPTSDRSQGLRS